VAAARGEGHGAPHVEVGPTLNFRQLRDQVVITSTGVAENLKSQTVFGFGLLAMVGILLFVGAMGKSAQLPLHVWLPDAMAGPTPVSALIHAATMVTAGVYMVARLNFIFALSPTAMGWVAFIGALTALFAASIGFFQYDIKKVLAYSTVSQLGFMFIGVGVGAYWAGAYHLLTHAFFKATLFLGSGSVILGCHHEQDMRKMGGLGKLMPVTKWTYLVACFAIAGFPWASGFYSKDEILWKAFTQEGLAFPFLGLTPHLGQLIYLMGIIAATGTSFYMFRSYYMTFTGEYRGGHGHDARPRPRPRAHAARIAAFDHVRAGGAGGGRGVGGGHWHSLRVDRARTLARSVARAGFARHREVRRSLARDRVPVPVHRRLGRRHRLVLRAHALQGQPKPSAGTAAGALEARLDRGLQQVLRGRAVPGHGDSRLGRVWRACCPGSTSTSSTAW
jgi:NADH-quinone oxidoreductase subunit L